jgi:CDP-diacylglycerol--glycerol-3-phosphate 3-phosphatidyltransferase
MITPFIIILSFFKCYKVAIVLIIISSLTDLLDGKLARYWKVTSLKGAKLDAIADKFFGIGLIICLTLKNHKVFIILLLEIIIAVTNLYYHKKTGKTQTLMIGKFKTTALFLFIITFYLCFIFKDLIFIRNGFYAAVINLQILCLILYFINYYKSINQVYLDFENNDETKVLNSLIDLAKKYGTYDEKDDFY